MTFFLLKHIWQHQTALPALARLTIACPSHPNYQEHGLFATCLVCSTQSLEPNVNDTKHQFNCYHSNYSSSQWQRCWQPCFLWHLTTTSLAQQLCIPWAALKSLIFTSLATIQNLELEHVSSMTCSWAWLLGQRWALHLSMTSFRAPSCQWKQSLSCQHQTLLHQKQRASKASASKVQSLHREGRYITAHTVSDVAVPPWSVGVVMPLPPKCRREAQLPCHWKGQKNALGIFRNRGRLENFSPESGPLESDVQLWQSLEHVTLTFDWSSTLKLHLWVSTDSRSGFCDAASIQFKGCTAEGGGGVAARRSARPGGGKSGGRGPAGLGVCSNFLNITDWSDEISSWECNQCKAGMKVSPQLLKTTRQATQTEKVCIASTSKSLPATSAWV